jgi:prepilin-type processing-associated H-X9-DG protein/prepilin-type N-terminal cleavage/methylation domain-containing protein
VAGTLLALVPIERRNCQINMRKERPDSFTLIEMLVAIGILGLLAALLLPGIMQAKRRAQGAKCVSNLRQLGLGLQGFLSDHHVYPLLENRAFSRGEYPEHGPGWREALEPQAHLNYPSSGASVWRCPSAQQRPPPGSTISYGYNAFGLFWAGPPRDHGLGGHTPESMSSPSPGHPAPPSRTLAPPVSESEVAVAGEMMAVLDYDLDCLMHRDRNISRRHQGRVNAVFCDGHVESPKATFVFEDWSDAALVRWNRDHQPHQEQLPLGVPFRILEAK